MHLYVRDEVRSNEESSKAARATRSEQTAQVPRCSLWIARPFFVTPNLRYDDRKFARKARRRPPKWMPKVASESQNRRKICVKSSKIVSWAALAAQSRFRDAPGRARERSRRARERSGRPKSRPGGLPERPRAAGNRPKVSPNRPQDAPGRPRSSARARFVRRAVSNTPAERFFVDFAWLCGSSDVPKS